MAFTVLSWNIEFFGSRKPGQTNAMVQNRINRVFDLLETPDIAADIIALYEVNGSQVFEPIQTRFPNHNWTISDGGGSQRILVGSSIPGTFVTVRTEFTHGFNGPLRPGMLVTVPDGGNSYPILFLHLKAADVPVDFVVRADQHERVRSLRRVLDNGDPNGQARFIVAGDLNSVGLDLTFSPADIESATENQRLKTMYGSQFDNMHLHSKSHLVTFWNGPGSSDDPVDIDHVITATNVNLQPVPGSTTNATVEVKGWSELTTPTQQGQWIDRFSDHAALRLTIT